MARLSALSALAGGTPVVPTLTAGQEVIFRGAVLSAPVAPEDGLEIWDALEILTTEPSFVGLSTTQLPMPTMTVDNSRGTSTESVKLLG
ncbi:hypothetical protein AB0E63_15745 [Kribbella sp. NPDC026596]|uniref:hypothetical protein n=1 Tax=Kribbella sp. NPDC026596 TaxID=3155122 RepID=UPI0033FED1BF